MDKRTGLSHLPERFHDPLSGKGTESEEPRWVTMLLTQQGMAC